MKTNKLTLNTKYINYNVTETGTNWKINLYVVTLFLPGGSKFWRFDSWNVLSLHTWWFTKNREIYGLHTNGWFTNYQCYGLLTLWGFTWTKGQAYYTGFYFIVKITTQKNKKYIIEYVGVIFTATRHKLKWNKW